MNEIISLLRKAEPQAINHIFLLGTTCTTQETGSIFISGCQSSQYTARCFLLILVTTDRECHELQDKFENGCKQVLLATTIVIKTWEFTRWLAEGHAFAYRVATGATALYHDLDSLPLTATTTPPEGEEKKKAALFKKGMERATSFYAGAELYRLRNEGEMAAFMLQQAAEHCLKMMVQVFTGYNCNTHSLDKLCRYGNMVAPALYAVWQRHQPAGEALFQLLQKAYVEARYRDHYIISQNDLSALLEKVSKLLQVAKETYLNSLADERKQ